MDTHQSDPSARFWDRIAKRYARTPIADVAAYEKKLEITRQYFDKDSNVLEFGCGTGSTAIALAPFVRRIRATDISSGMLDIARAKVAEANVNNVDFEQASIESVVVEDGSLDVVMGMSILHLVDARSAAIDRVWRMLKPGGVFVSSTACLADSHWFLRPVLPIGRVFGWLPHVAFFTRRELEASLTTAGFGVELSWQPARRKAVFVVARKL